MSPASRRKGTSTTNLAKVAGIARVAHERPVALALPTKVSVTPEGDEWIHEIKADGFRIQTIIRDGKVRCVSRQGLDWTKALPSIVAHVSQIGLRNAQFDGELVAVNSSGREDFHLLQSLVRRRADPKAPLRYIAFDLVRLEDWSLVSVPLIERKRILQEVIRGSQVAYSTHHQGQGKELFAAAKAAGAEGLVSKRIDSAYPSGRTRLWVKTIANPRQRRHDEDET